jgi:hypothetical protein
MQHHYKMLPHIYIWQESLYFLLNLYIQLGYLNQNIDKALEII